MIGVKTTVITSATFAIGIFKLKKKKHEQMDGVVVFCQEVWRCTSATWGVLLGREMLE